jgi:KaiC/GvpD/RAD55 family RecA-like ATPase
VSWQEFQDRRATDDEKTAWKQKFPRHNSGIVTGPISGLFVLDVDGEQGEKSLASLHVPKTVTVKTPHGRHFYFKYTSELEDKITTKVGVLNKVDVRGAGGMVAFYGWEYGPNVRPLLAPPQWLIDLLPSKNSPKVIGDSFKKLDFTAAMQSLKEGNRNETLFKLASSLRARGFELKEIYETLLPKAKEVGISEKELYTLSQSSCKYPAGQRPPIAEDSISLDSFEQFLQDERPVSYIVPGIFAKNSIAFVAGLPETCKTWTLIDLAIELARKTNGTWLGRIPVVNTKVLYIDQERDKSETQRRFKALMLAKGLQPKDLNDSLVVKCGTSTKINLQHSFDAFKRLLSQVRPSLVLIDSFKAFHSADINSNVQMQEVMEKIKELKNEFGCSFSFIFHENKSAFERIGADGKKKSVTFEHMAGAMVMSEVAETILITVKQDNDSSFLYHVKNTYGQKVAPVLVSVENVLPDKSQIKVIAR